MPITIHTSNRMETVLDHLAGVLAVPVGPVLSPETVVVQSRGMARWISMELAKKFGVWGNGAFPFPNKFVQGLFTATMPDVTVSESFAPDIATWRVIDQLEQLLERPEFKELRTYLTGQNRALKLYQLAAKIADTFDQYTLYRGDVLQRWEAGYDGGWQAILWKELAGTAGTFHRAHVKAEFLSRLAKGQIDVSLFPPRILVFGLSYLPVFHLEVFAAIASCVEVHFFVLSPCREYWGDIVAARSGARQNREFNAAAEEGNALLASLGGLGKNFSNLILSCDAPFNTEQDEYHESGGTSLLSSLQDGILNLVNAAPDTKITVAPDDCSISVHACHSPMREVEVLHDQLLLMFAEIDGLAPRDIIVMTPDIESYSSYISAVFSGGQDQKRRIPFTIADRSMRSEGRVGDALLAILALPGGRFTAPEVIDILASEPVCRCFDMSREDSDLVRNWLEETRITWGMSGHDRSVLGLPGYAEGSWMAGLERLVFGYAMSSDTSGQREGGTLFDGILPFDNMEGDAATVLGHFVRFVTALHVVAGDLARPRLLARWKETLHHILRDFFTPSDQDVREYDTVVKVVDSLEQIVTLSGYSGEVSLDVIRAWLRKRLDDEGAGIGFLSGKVTFCAMLPMRSIPAKVVALLGMNDGSFPRQSRSPGFDIIPAQPRPGDRSLRDEDHYLFLEALLSARERLYVSYIGLSIRDNSIIPPSVLVSELLDFLDRGYTRGDGLLHTSLLVMHRLQPFSPAYFDGKSPHFFSYSPENLHAATGLLAHGTYRPHFFTGPLPEPDNAFRELRIADLLKFFENPAASILRQRLGIRPEQAAAPLEERELFELDSLQAYGIKKELLAYLLNGHDANELLPVVRARGVLPPAGQGDAVFEKLAAEAAVIAGKVLDSIAGQTFLPPLDVDLTIGEFRLYGRINTLLPERLLRFRSSKLSAKDQVKLWLEHLILNAVADEGYPKKSTLIMLNETVALRPVADSKNSLEELLRLYWQGLTLPLHFFPRSSLAYAKKGTLTAAAAEWHNERYPESDDPGYRLCFGDVSPLDGAFAAIASKVFTSYLQHLEGEQ
ncbi:MAG: exodeoxyribonuclease V subunit gamma [Desulfuromonadaceae bacterium]|nr:exodeoxyribonuclease V subunit gamma [Desulfuromonadaceae bacterium]MDD5107213.1 exodeoxyribonuclease V subunit gamma [Desulfuromonadaceae bacterium]